MKFSTFKKYLAMIGKVPLCNKKKERAPHIFGLCFPLCYRCSGIILGAIFCLIINLVKYIPDNLINILICIVLALPLIIDGVRQYFFNKLSNNTLRLLTGVFFGYSLSLAVNLLKSLQVIF